jgi:diguanylate cyclase (GGDEF)-like protein/PAS domain S-box-containing protein
VELLIVDHNTLDQDALRSHFRPHHPDPLIIHTVTTSEELHQVVSDRPRIELVLLVVPPPGRELVDVLGELSHAFPIAVMILVTGSSSSLVPISQVDTGRVSFLPVHQLARLPFMLRHWRMREQRQVVTAGVLPNMSSIDLDVDVYQTIAGLTADYVYIAEVNPDRTIRVQYRSEALPQLTGFSHQEIDEGGPEILVHPDDQHIIPARRVAMLNGDSRVDEFRLVTRDQRVIWIRDFAQPARLNEHGLPQLIVGAAQDITSEKLLQSRLTLQASILGMIAHGEARDAVLTALNDLIEEQISDAYSSIQLLDKDAQVLRPAVECRLPAGFVDAIRELPVGPQHGACGCAVYYKALTIATDIDTDPRFESYRELMHQYQLLAVWSTPIFAPDGSVAGTMALYFSQPRTPIDHEIALMESAAQIAGLALDVQQREIERQLAQVQYQTLVEQLPAMTLMAHPSDPCDLTYLSPQFALFSELPARELIRAPDKVRSFVHEDDRERFEAAVQRSIDTGEPLQIEFRLRRVNGTVAWIQTSLALVHDQQGQPLHWLGIMLDVTDRNKAIHERALADQRYRSLFDENLNPIVIYNYEGIVTDVNPAAERVSGYSADDLMGDRLTWLVAPDQRERAERYFLQARAGIYNSFNVAIINKQGERVELASTHGPLVVDGQIVGVTAISEDVTDRRRLESQLLYQAYHDPLTALPNRIYFDHMLSNEIETLGRNVELAMLFLDLNNFKVINDSLGHDIGDQYLADIARSLRDVVPSDFVVARFGGDEFTILVTPRPDALDIAVDLARQIIARLEIPISIDRFELGTSVSVGIAAITFDSMCEPRELIRRADIALYDAKGNGRDSNLRVFDESMDEWVLERLWIEGDLRQALRNGEFVVHFQPLVDPETGEVAVVEALLRWNHPERGLLRPGRFLRIAEETGHIMEIDRWVMEQACEVVARWNEQHPDREPLEVGVNLSSRRFWHSGMIEDVLDILEKSGLDPSLLCIEITESTMIQDMDHAIEVVNSLREQGVMFAIDDFGTGYSSLSYIRQFPVDVLKIDRTFITSLSGNEQQTRLAEAIVAMARALDLYVIAEGVETREDMEGVRALKCDLVQGYYLSYPVPFEDLKPMIDGALMAGD